MFIIQDVKGEVEVKYDLSKHIISEHGATLHPVFYSSISLF